MDLSPDSLTAIRDIISQQLATALSITIADVEERVQRRLEERLNERVAAIEEKFDSTIRGLEEKVSASSESNKKLKDTIFKLENKFLDLHDQLEDQEQRGHRFNVRIENVAFDVEPRAETEEMLFSKVQSELKS